MKKIILLIVVLFSVNVQTLFCDELPLDVKISGTGSRSIIFIPGFSCSGEVWDETVNYFEKDFKCYVLTMPGFAGVKPESSPVFKNWVTYIAEYIKENDIDKPIVIGHSIGGGMAMLLAASYPKLVSRIVVVDALPCMSAVSDSTFKAKEIPDCSESIDRYKKMSDDEFYAIQKTSMKYLMADTVNSEKVIQWGFDSDRNTLGTIFCQFLNTDLRDTIENIQCPTLVLLEPNFKYAEKMVTSQYSKLKGAQLVYGTKGLHFIMYDDKDWYLDQIKKFLN
ncbi:MAG: alpha/beta hydrolase [bacterium]